MASQAKRLSTNVTGNFFVDSTCINCDTCRQLAPDSFREQGEYSSVHRQPQDRTEVHRAYQALLACPVGSIGAVVSEKAEMAAATATFPVQVEAEVFYNGFHSEKSFGASSYFIQHPQGNWLIDSPRYQKHLVESFERMGGVRYIFLSHEDDVADASRYAKHFGSTRIIHRADMEAQPDAEWVVEGWSALEVSSEFRILPVPGHTSGSLVLIYKNRYLFSGDHMAWDRNSEHLRLATRYVWSEEALQRSTRALFGYQFEWVLPVHGDRIHLPEARMRRELETLIEQRVAWQGEP